VMLIGAGLSNRDVAARLTISVCTVESHIFHAMAKTGTGGREDLAALLPRRQPAPNHSPLAGALATEMAD
jgi:DNA-binding CsgD family transcriptional regulator